ncbi:prepilin-type N-terminal cleavage/methylation domain-containing protein, partial [bacterium]|nr:prepilin-type N-terminal cleavage/methylation domain-containing protein [bacterium]
MKRFKYGFTLAETLITLSILGIVAAITIPSLVGRQIESQNRTKLKKAMTMYEKAINNML